MSKISILLSATVNPKETILIKRNNPEIRELDYIKSLQKWAKNVEVPIIFCENSCFDIKRIRESVRRFGDKIEFLQFDGMNYPNYRGKGVGLMNILEYAIENSNFIKNSDFIIQVSGRYYVENINDYILFLTKEKDIYIMADIRNNFKIADSRIFAFRPDFITNYLLEYKTYINDSKGIYFEHAFAKAILKAIIGDKKWASLPKRPQIIGYSASSGKKYKNNMVYNIFAECIHKIRNFLFRI